MWPRCGLPGTAAPYGAERVNAFSRCPFNLQSEDARSSHLSPASLCRTHSTVQDGFNCIRPDVTPWLSDKTCGGGRCDSNAPQMWRFSVFNLFFHHLLTSNRLNNWSTDRSMREIIVGYHLQTVFALRLRWKYNITDFPFVLSPIFGYINLKLNKIERTPGSDRFWSCSAACEAEAHHIWIDHCSGSPNSFHPASIWVWLKRLQTLPLASRIISNTTNLSLNSRHFTGAVNTSSCRMDQVCVFGAVTGTYLLFVVFLPAVW